MQKNESVDQERQIIRLTERLQDLFRKSGITGENVMHLISSYFTMALFTKDRADCSDLFDHPHESYYTLKDKQAWEDAYQMLSLVNLRDFCNRNDIGNDRFQDALKKLSLTYALLCKDHMPFSQQFNEFGCENLTPNLMSQVAEELLQSKFWEFDHDAMTTAYDNFLRHYDFGRDLGQFFTPDPIRQLLLDGIGEIKSGSLVCDPACGTGALLIQAWKRQNSVRIFGKELSPVICSIAIKNVWIFTKDPDAISRGDTLEKNWGWDQFDIMVMNPPFGVKTTDKKDIDYPVPSETNIVSLFIQIMIKCLKCGGKAGVVVPAGSEANGRNTVKTRKILFQTCNVYKIVINDDGLFQNTSAKTFCLFFQKIVSGKDIRKHRDNKKEIINYSTEKLIFSKMDGTIIGEATMQEIVDHNYSLNPDDYFRKQTFSLGVQIYRLGDICEISSGKQITKKEIAANPGPYPVIGGGKKYKGYYNQYNDQNILTISSGGKGTAGTVLFTEGVCWIGGDCHKITPLKFSNRFLYCCLKRIEKQIMFMEHGTTGMMHVNKSQLQDLMVEIPDLTIIQQDEYAQKMMESEKTLNQVVKNLEERLDLYKKVTFFLPKFISRSGWEPKKIFEICTISRGKAITTKELKSTGTIPVIGGGANLVGTHTEFNYENVVTVAKDGSCGYVQIWPAKVFATGHAYVLTPLLIPLKVLYAILKAEESNLNKLGEGTAQQGIKLENFSNYMVLIPPSEDYQKIIDLTDDFYKKIKDVEDEITMWKEMIPKIIENSFDELVAVNSSSISLIQSSQQQSSMVPSSIILTTPNNNINPAIILGIDEAKIENAIKTNQDKQVTVKDLQAYAKLKKIKVLSKDTKAELIQIISKNLEISQDKSLNSQESQNKNKIKIKLMIKS